jgi:hypothetical protein
MYIILFVLMLIILYVINQQKSKTLTYILGLVSIILIVCANTHDNIEQFTNGLQYAHIDYKMGPMSGLKLKDVNNIHRNESNTFDGRKLQHTESGCGWRHPPCNVPLLKRVDVTTPVGDDIQLTDDPASYSFPTVDGDKNSPQKMFMLAHNQISPKCCPSTYSTDRGCVCLTKKQRDYISSRGGNKSYSALHDI